MNPFKMCPKCKYEWNTKEDFINDETLRIIGFQASFNPTDEGLFLFNHLLENNKCNTTLAVGVESFMSFYDGPVYEEIRAGSEVCSGHCTTVENLAKCEADCRNAVVRDVMRKVFKI